MDPANRFGHGSDDSSSVVDTNENERDIVAERLSTATKLTGKENRAVGVLRFVVFLVLGIVAAVVCLSVYYVGRRNERSQFEDEFIDLGAKLASSFSLTLQQRLGILGEFGMDITTFAKNWSGNSSWPFLVIPDFERRAATTARLADMMAIATVPLVRAGDLEKWNAFANEHQGWREEGIATRTGVPIEEVQIDPIYTEMKSRANLSNTNAPEIGPGPYFPTWQRFPAIDFQNVNVNLFSHKPHIGPLETILATKQPVLPKSFDYWDRSKWNVRREVFMKIVETYDGVYDNDPLVTIFYPSE